MTTAESRVQRAWWEGMALDGPTENGRYVLCVMGLNPDTGAQFEIGFYFDELAEFLEVMKQTYREGLAMERGQ